MYIRYIHELNNYGLNKIMNKARQQEKSQWAIQVLEEDIQKTMRADCNMVQVVSCWPLIMKVLGQSRASSC
jgi:hypothetical protein